MHIPVGNRVMKSLRTSRPGKKKRKSLPVLMSLVIAQASALATDGQPILDLGIVSWLDYQRQSLFANVAEVNIRDGRIEDADITIELYQPVIFQSLDEGVSHRLVFLPDIDNHMDDAYTSAVIRPGERWGAEFQGFGVFPYHCTVHAEEHGKVTVVY